MKMDKLYVETFGRGMTWFDTGTHDALLETASFVQTIEKKTRFTSMLSRRNSLSK